MTRILALRILLAVVVVGHLVLGGLALYSPPEDLANAVVELAYGASVTLTPQLRHVIRMLGAFMIAVGVLAGFALIDPVRNRAIIDGLVVLLLIRVGQRILLADEIEGAFGVSVSRLWGQSAFFLVLAIALFVLRPKPKAAQEQ